MRGHAVRRTLLLAALALLLLPVPPVGAAAGGSGMPAGHLGLRLLDVPVVRKDDPRARVYVVDHVEAGTTLRRRVEVVSSLSRTTVVDLYPASAEVVGGAFVGHDGRAADELSSWTRVSPSSVTVPPGGRVTAEVAIAVPPGAGGGERYGVVWAEHRAPGASGVVGVSRVGVRTYLSVGGPVEPASDFVVDALTARRLADGTPVVEARVRNTGGRALDLGGSLLLAGGPGGTSAGPFPLDRGTTVGVGESAPVTTRLDPALPEGPWTARLEVRSGAVVRTVQGVLSLPRTGSDTVAPRDVTPTPSTTSWLDRVLEVLAGLLVALLLLLWRRRRRREDEEPPAGALPGDGPAPLAAPLPAPLPPPLPRPRRAPVRA